MSSKKTVAAKPKAAVAHERDELKGTRETMPVLSNARHEKFAQELAKGRSQIDAYETAGYVGDRTAASRLSTNVNIRNRVDELQGRGAIRTELTIASLTKDLLRIAKKGERLAEASGLSVARGAIMDAAKLNGFLADPKPARQDGFVPLAERIAAYDRQRALVGSAVKVVELKTK